jgi:uncharacterized protein YkwD
MRANLYEDAWMALNNTTFLQQILELTNQELTNNDSLPMAANANLDCAAKI